jgi:hypothetical protein
MIASMILVTALSQGVIALANERKSDPHLVTPEFREQATKMIDDVVRSNNFQKLPDYPAPPHKKLNLNLALSDATGVCFGAIGPWIPWDGDGDTTKLNQSEFLRSWTCESRDSVVKALGFTSFFLKGSGYVCSLTPLPQAQIAAKAFDVASYASSGISLVVSVTKCENTLETKFDALLKACENLKTMGANCQGVDDSPF